MLEPWRSQLTERTEAESKYQPSGLADCPQILVLHTVICSTSTVFPPNSSNNDTLPTPLSLVLLVMDCSQIRQKVPCNTWLDFISILIQLTYLQNMVSLLVDCPVFDQPNQPQL